MTAPVSSARVPQFSRGLRGAARDRIFDEAVRLFGARDFSDVSMQDVADAAGVTKAALYYHFKDKIDLYYRTLLARVDAVRLDMEAAVAKGGALEERLLRLALVGLQRLENDVYRPHLHSHQHLDDERHAEVHHAMERLQEPLVRTFEQAGAADPNLAPRAAATLFAGLIGSLLMFGGDPMGPTRESALPAEPEVRVRLAISLFLRGYWSVAQDPETSIGRD